MMKKKILMLSACWFLLVCFLPAITGATDPDLELETMSGPTMEPPKKEIITEQPAASVTAEPPASPAPAALPGTTVPAPAAEKAKAEPEKQQQLISLNFQNTEIGMVLKFFSEITGLTFILGDNVQGNVTVISTKRIPVDQAMEMLQSILDIKGYTMVKADNAVKVVTQAEAGQKNIEIRTTEKGLSGDDRVITQIIPLKFLQATDVRNDLQPLVSRNGNMLLDARTNSLILTDVASNIKKIMKVIDYMDVQVYNDRIKVDIIPLQYTEETAMAARIKTILSSTMPKMVTSLEIVPDSRMHALIVITPQNNLTVVRELAARLDKESPSTSDNTRVFFMQNSKVSEISRILTDVMNKGGSSNIMEGGLNVVTDERTNALIITTASQNFAGIERIIKQLDVRTPQVLIKALIMEVSLNSEDKMGVEWTYTHDWGPTRPEISGTATQQFGLNSFIGDGIKYAVLKSDKSFSAMLAALSTDQRVNILSTPQVMASNNQLATISIGQEVPILKDVTFVKSDVSVSGEMVKTYEYKPVTIQLDVTPRINTERDVVLDVQLVIKKILGTNAELNAPILATRNAKTNVVVKDGQTVAIGGLMQDDDSVSNSKVPLIGDIPILGWIFRKHDLIREKTELMVFITPYVVLDSDEADKLTRDQESLTSMKRTPNKLSAKKYYENGVRLYRRGEYAKAIEEFSLTMAESPDTKLVTKAQKYIKKANIRLQKATTKD
jgi:general secretion pathway protein D